MYYVCPQCPVADRGLQAEGGLIMGQGYTFTAAKLVEPGKTGQRLELVRLFNPWEAKEWKGAWSDGSVVCEGVAG